MFHTRALYNRKKKIHEQIFRIVCQSNNELRELDNSGSVHHGNLLALATDIMKVKKI